MRGVLGMGDIAKHPEPAKSESTWSTMKEGEWVVRRGGRAERRKGGEEEGWEGRGGGGYPSRTPKEQSFNFGFWSCNSNVYEVYQIII